MSSFGARVWNDAGSTVKQAASDVVDVPNLDPRKVAVACVIGSEVAFFGTLFVAYGVYMGASTTGPTPHDALRLSDGLIGAAFLLPSSFTIAMAVRAFTAGRTSRFLLWLAATIALGVLFLLNTAWEWYDLIFRVGLTLRTNLFGTTFYTLVGFHALHVTLGVLVMLILFLLAARKRLLPAQAVAPELFSWYWHFVDVVWIGILLMVYVFSR